MLIKTLESPNFPIKYPRNANCEWKITPPPGNRVFIEFSHFEMEHPWSSDDDSRSVNCMFDHLTIEERDSSDTVVRSDKYCQSMPKPINTTYTVVLKYVEFY